MKKSDAVDAFPVDRVESELIVKLIRGEYRAGDYLPGNPRLARMCGVSVTTLRAALGRLLSRGLLTWVPGRGMKVEEILESCDLDLLMTLINDKVDGERALELEAQLLDLMSVVFLEVVYRAMICRTEEHVKWFNHYLRVILDCIDQDGHLSLVLSAQFQLLRVLAAAGGNVVFTVLLNSMRPYLEGRAALELFPPDAWSRLREALETKDTASARQIFQRCFDRRTAKVLQLLLKARGSTSGDGGASSGSVDLVAWTPDDP